MQLDPACRASSYTLVIGPNLIGPISIHTIKSTQQLWLWFGREDGEKQLFDGYRQMVCPITFSDIFLILLH